MRIFRQIAFVLVGATFIALAVNSISPNGIAVIGDYPEIDTSRTKPVVPPEADEGDPPYISYAVAKLDHNDGRAIFVDSRDSAEYTCGTIPGAINIPFEYMPEDDDLGPYFDSALAGAARDNRIVVFCSGEECDLSVHLARNLIIYEYSDLVIFFGGSREWKRFSGDLERRPECGE